ncbi:MAG TPA: amino acid adenylation domain-containing protein, partial [Pyrinomonadaceae bacterium]|nr:amino acid adenylation domain-containing protein [Pyrinomonadaceae bacterium]
RTDLSGDPDFQELLSREKEVALGAYAHQDLPFERLVEELQPQRSLSHPPLFQVWFNLLAVDELHAAVELKELVAEPVASSEIQAKFELSLYAFEHDQSIELQFVYNADLFDDSTINKMLGHLRTLLESIAGSRGQRISQLNLLTEEEKSEAARNRNEAIRASSAFVAFEREQVDSTLTERFEQQVRMYPDNVAVMSKSHRWSYQELNAAANRIAGEVLERIGGPDQILSLLLSHDTPMIAALLGVLKAGNSYVPLDPSNPHQRTRYILEDSQSKAVLTDDANFELANSLIGGRLPIINIDRLDANRAMPILNRTDMTPDRMVYILYTSGSTGVPKGVVQNHRNVMHFIRNYTNNLKISAEDNLALLASHSFDAAVMDVYGALLNGATLCPLDLREAGVKGLPAWLIERQITIYHSTPTVYRYFINELKEDYVFPKLRLVVLGGEEVCKSDVEAYKRFFNDTCVLVNGFGPTESTVALQFFVSKDTNVRRNSVPIGFPVDETEVLLLNADRRASGVRGEIAMKSPYVALGYWRKPELTQTAFLSAQGAARIYLTGDMGRLLPDGSIEYSGRKDDQVKIRGMRVEPGEIESILCRHPAVRECIVTARPGRLGETSLVAYVVARDAQIVDRTVIKQYLRDNLPAYMIPAGLVTMDALPLTPTGKIDRRSLPAPDWSLRETEAEFIPAQTSTAQTLAEMWRELLSVDRISIHDNFFDLGGHSLLATRLASRIREVFRIDVPLRSLFETQTLGDLSALIDTLLESDNGHSASEIRPYSRDAYRVKDLQEMSLKART